MVLVSVGVVVEMFGEALRLVLTQVLLKKKGLTLNPITTLYYIAPMHVSYSHIFRTFKLLFYL
jgi:hypothetical protein